jgi:hypothetical protein
MVEPGETGDEAATPPKRLKFPVALAILAIMVILVWVVGRRRRTDAPASGESPTV